MLAGSKLERQWNSKHELSREEVEFLNARSAHHLRIPL